MKKPITDKMPYELFGNGTPPETTRERILECAQELFYSKGFHGVGIDEIAERAGVTKATFYNHFDSRDALTAETVRRADAQLHAQFMHAVRERAKWDPKAALLAMFDVLNEWFNHPDFSGCLFVKACMAFPNQHDPIHKAASQHYIVTASEISELAKAAGISDAESFSEEWVLLIEGALSHRVVTLDDRAAVVAKRLAEVTLDRWTATKP
jgi:AcrR family transcriptional regulator